jgi:hypothetical protein
MPSLWINTPICMCPICSKFRIVSRLSLKYANSSHFSWRPERFKLIYARRLVPAPSSDGRCCVIEPWVVKEYRSRENVI